jgi:hypothetical protein
MCGDPQNLGQDREIERGIVPDVINPRFGSGGVWNSNERHLVKSGHQERVWMCKLSTHRVAIDLLSQP